MGLDARSTAIPVDAVLERPNRSERTEGVRETTGTRCDVAEREPVGGAAEQRSRDAIAVVVGDAAADPVGQCEDDAAVDRGCQ
jgi:hypothetical protein